MPQRILVTGGAGFIGSHLVRRLLTVGHQVTVLDDLSTGRAANLPDGALLEHGDLLDLPLLQRLTDGAQRVFHLAARVSVQLCISDWMAAHRVNLGGSIAVFQAAQRAGNVPVIYASSAAVYGNRAGSCTETDLPQPISPYGADKLGSEHQARAMAEVHGLPSVGLRFFNVYGPGQDAASPYAGVISKFCANRRAGRGHELFGDGGQSRDFVYVADVVEGLLCAAQNPPQGAGVWNICTGAGTTLLELTAALDDLAGRGASPVSHAAARAGDIRESLGDPAAARAALGFSARTGITEGLRALWDQPGNGAGS